MSILQLVCLCCLASLVSGYHKPLTEIGGNLEYMETLAESGLISRAARRPVVLPDPWNSTFMKGVGYIPSTALNQMFQWHDYDGALVRKELGYASAATANTVRVSLHWAVWYVDGASFLSNLEDFISAASALSLRVVLVIFDELGQDPGGDAVGLLMGGGYKTQPWLQNPGFSQLNNASLLPTLDAYVAALTSKYGKDPRVVGWDALFEPNLCADNPPCPTPAFLSRFLGALSAAVSPAVAWVTTSIIPGAECCDAKNVPSVGRTAVGFENYNGNRGAVGGDTQGVQGCAASLNPASPPPVMLTGSMGRFENPPSALCEILFEAGGQPFIDIPAHPQIGYIIPSLMIGVDEFSSGLNQGLVWPNGSWYDAQEQACFMAAVAPFPPPPPGPRPCGVNFTTPDGLSVGLRNSTRSVEILGLTNDTRWFGNFSFVPPLWNYIPAKPHRDFPGCHHVGDLTLRVQPASETNASSWAFYSSAQGGDAVPAVPLPLVDPAVQFDFSNLTDATTAPGQLDTRYPLGLQVLRSIEKAPGGMPGFAIRWNISAPTWATEGVRVGGLGFSLISDSFFGGVNNTQIAAFGSFLEAHVGSSHGWSTITRADGSRTLLVTTCGGGDATALTSGMEAWRTLLEDPSPPSEGMWEWTVHSAAWASEWAINAQAPDLTFPNDPAHEAAWPHPKSPWPSWHLSETVWVPNPRPWNPPTSITLQPGQSAEYALCFSLPPAAADPEGMGGPRARDAGLAAAGKAVIVNVPGTVLSSEMMGAAAMFVTVPTSMKLASAATDDPAVLNLGTPTNLGGGLYRVPISGMVGARGRARVTLHFSDSSVASVHYYILPPLLNHSATYGAFGASTSWLPRSFPDSFGRSASFMPWDREDGVHVLQDARPFVVGLSDDAGASANLGMASKLAASPHALQLSLLDEYVNATLLGIKMDVSQPPYFSLQNPQTWAIFMTLWYFDKVPLNSTGYYEETNKCTIGPSWCAFNSPWCNPEWCSAAPPNSGGSGWAPATYRQYNFPHQIAVYWSLYLSARNYPHIPLLQSADFYLNAALQSIYAVNCADGNGTNPSCLVSVGLMDGTVFREVLRCLQAEGEPYAAAAAAVESLMRQRTQAWNVMDNPAGSEFAWDTTGQEEVSIWGAYFNSTSDLWMQGELNERTVDSILAYQASVPTFAHDGSAYGMGDMSNNAKWMVTGGWEREGGHYRSGLNSIPLIERYRAHPNDFYLLQTGIAGIMSSMPNIDGDGAPSMAFHTHPFIMEHDPNSGDHGLAWFGSSLNAGGYVHNHASLGLLCFMCSASGSVASGLYGIAQLQDTYHRRAYIEPLGLWVVAEAGTLASLQVNAQARTVTVTLDSTTVAQQAAGMASPPYDVLRIRFEEAAPSFRPYNFTFLAPSNAVFSRNAWAFPPNADPAATTQATLGF